LIVSGSAQANSVTITVVVNPIRVTPPSTSGTVGINFDTAPPSLINTLQVNPPKLDTEGPKYVYTVVIDSLVDVTRPTITGTPPKVTFANGGFTLDGGSLTVTPGSVRLTPEGERLLKEAAKKGKMALIEARKRTVEAMAAAQQNLDRAKADAEQAINRLKNDVEAKANQLKSEWSRMLTDVANRIQAKKNELAEVLRNLPRPPGF
jgi:hypothetical protein